MRESFVAFASLWLLLVVETSQVLCWAFSFQTDARHKTINSRKKSKLVIQSKRKRNHEERNLLDGDIFDTWTLPMMSGGWHRRSVLTTLPILSTASSVAVALEPRPRSVDVGGGVDVSVDTRTAQLSNPNNLVFPTFLQGKWTCQRTVLSVDGDFYQAQSAWQVMRGSRTGPFGPKAPPEVYPVEFVALGQYTVLDRALEYQARSAAKVGDVQWNLQQPNILTSGSNELAVIQRSVNLPNLDQGILAGGQELIRVQEGPFARAILIKQRFRPTSNGDPNRMEGLELMKTFRVLDGIAGTEFPTSTTKSLLQFTRLQDDTDANKLVSSKNSNSLYFDGSNWY